MRKDIKRRNNRLIYNALRRYMSEHKLLFVLMIICYVGLCVIGIANASVLDSTKQDRLAKAKKLDSTMSLESLQSENKHPSIFIIQELQGGGIIFKACSVREVVILAQTYCKNDIKACDKAVLITAEQGDEELQQCFNKQSAYVNFIKIQGTRQ